MTMLQDATQTQPRIRPLRPYQVEVGRAVMHSILHRRGLTFTVEMARQAGKNELSGQLEALLLSLFVGTGGNLVKASPTFRPQTVNSMIRLKDRLDEAGLRGLWRSEQGYIVRLGKARALFFSADTSSNVVGATAHLLLEVDEAQDVPEEKYTKDFRPMGSSTNVTTVLYGTAWDEGTLLEQTKQVNLELERKDGVKRHFRFDWREVARYNPDYARFVAAERERLGEAHPLFQTQYALNPVHGGGGFLSPQQRAQLQGSHPRQRRPEPAEGHRPQPGRVYVAGVDIAGQDESGEDGAVRTASPRRDSTVVTIAEVDYSAGIGLAKLPQVRVVEHLRWTGVDHGRLYERLVDVLRGVWGCRRVVVDATGLGQGIASFLVDALGRSVVTPFTFTVQNKSHLGYQLLAAVNSGRLKQYAADGSEESATFWREMELARSSFRPNQTMSFSVDPARGHDDFLMSLALAMEAAETYRPRSARGRAAESE